MAASLCSPRNLATRARLPVPTASSSVSSSRMMRCVGASASGGARAETQEGHGALRAYCGCGGSWRRRRAEGARAAGTSGGGLPRQARTTGWPWSRGGVATGWRAEPQQGRGRLRRRDVARAKQTGDEQGDGDEDANTEGLVKGSGSPLPYLSLWEGDFSCNLKYLNFLKYRDPADDAPEVLTTGTTEGAFGAGEAGAKEAGEPVPPHLAFWQLKGEAEAYEVASQAREMFTRLVSRGDDIENLGLAALLIALEEEAGIMTAFMEAGMTWGQAADCVELGGATTWSLERLDALAAEVLAEFRSSFADAPVAAEDANEVAEGVSGASAQHTDGTKRKGAGAPPLPADYPLTALEAINEVLFVRHGYSRPQRHHNHSPYNSLLPKVLEGGCGSPVLIGIIFLEVARRIGLPMHGTPLNEGPGSDYFVLWPCKELSCAVMVGDDMVVDAYDKGQLWRRSEMLEMFEIEEFVPASSHEMLASILGSLRDAYWTRAVQCRPEPYHMKHLSLKAAAAGDVGCVAGHDLERAIAAAARLVLVASDPEAARKARLDHALLLFHAGIYDDAWMELGALQESIADDDTELRSSLEVLVARIGLLMEEAYD